jgi:hypothetical protein
MRERYEGADKTAKSRLLDEVCEVTGYHRKAVIRLTTVSSWYWAIEIRALSMWPQCSGSPVTATTPTRVIR